MTGSRTIGRSMAALGLVAVLLGGCGRKSAEPAEQPADNVTVPLPPPPAPKPAAPVPAPKPAAAEPKADEPSLSEEQQRAEDADATGLTDRLPPAEDLGEPAFSDNAATSP